MKQNIYNHYDIDDIKQLIKDALQEAKVPSVDQLIEFKDAILKELKDMREEVALVTGYKDQIEDHEIRLETVEKHLNISQPTTS